MKPLAPLADPFVSYASRDASWKDVGLAILCSLLVGLLIASVQQRHRIDRLERCLTTAGATVGSPTLHDCLR